MLSFFRGEFAVFTEFVGNWRTGGLPEDAGLAEAEEEEDNAEGLSEEWEFEFGRGLVRRSWLTSFCRSQYHWSKT